MKRKRRSIAILALVMVLSSGLDVFAEMIDIEDHWARREIVYLTNKDIINGYEDGSFGPDKNLSKVEFFKIVNGLVGSEEGERPSFRDVKRGDWFYKELEKALYLGYIDNGGYIHPNEPIEREEVARILAFIYKVCKKSTPSVL